ncbi:MAG: alpha/beta fold hydrolase [Deltaproteobacteria bacterium]|nr:alpha/beta fold hydrolase [Deltaproteobacteria bacterium]
MDVSRSWHPAGRWTELPRFGRVHHVSLGSGPAVVLLHGFLQSSWAWRCNLDALADQYTVHALCVPGFGWSDKPRGAGYRLVTQAERVLALCDVLGVGLAHWVGNSLGAALALQIAWLAPERADRLVLVNPAGRDLGVFNFALAVQHAAWEPLLAVPGVKLALELGLRHIAYADLARDRAFVRLFLAPLDTPGARHVALVVAQHFGRDLRALEPRLPEIRPPALVLWGEGDGIVPHRTAARTAALLPNGRLEPFDCSAHCPMEEEPRRFNREVLAFLGGGDP